MIETVPITNNNVIEDIRESMPVATATKKGLMDTGIVGNSNYASNILVASESTPGTHFSFGAILSVSGSTGGTSSLYFLSISRAVGSERRAVEVTVLSGSYVLPIVWKVVDGKLAVYLKRTDYTPVVGVLVLSNSSQYLKLRMDRVTDETELEGATEATIRE